MHSNPGMRVELSMKPAKVHLGVHDFGPEVLEHITVPDGQWVANGWLW